VCGKIGDSFRSRESEKRRFLPNMSALSVVEELWNIFTYYSLHGDPLDPEHLRPTQLIKMLSKDCGLVNRDTGLLDADIHNCYQAEVTRSDKIAPGDARPHSLLKMAPSRPTKVLHTDRKKVRDEIVTAQFFYRRHSALTFLLIPPNPTPPP